MGFGKVFNASQKDDSAPDYPLAQMELTEAQARQFKADGFMLKELKGPVEEGESKLATKSKEEAKAAKAKAG
jgi:hypothetical protein